MMDPYNLAICFGPTLMPPPPDLDQVEFQSNVNDVVKMCINHHRRIFDPTVPGAYYEKFAAYASAVPPVLPRTIASEAVKKACSLRRQAAAPTAATAATITSQQASEGDSQRSSHRPGINTSEVAGTVGVSQRAGGKQAGFNSSTDRLSIDDGLDDDNDDESDSDIEVSLSERRAMSLFAYLYTRRLTKASPRSYCHLHLPGRLSLPYQPFLLTPNVHITLSHEISNT
ncbi:SLIT-ROBO Rho GTPase-activating protein 1 [Taenia solium]|eukprot:TsM_000399300 transcript=TsM_000399300 gene=TsM_000399300